MHFRPAPSQSRCHSSHSATYARPSPRNPPAQTLASDVHIGATTPPTIRTLHPRAPKHLVLSRAHKSRQLDRMRPCSHFPLECTQSPAHSISAVSPPAFVLVRPPPLSLLASCRI